MRKTIKIYAPLPNIQQGGGYFRRSLATSLKVPVEFTDIMTESRQNSLLLLLGDLNNGQTDPPQKLQNAAVGYQTPRIGQPEEQDLSAWRKDAPYADLTHRATNLLQFPSRRQGQSAADTMSVKDDFAGHRLPDFTGQIMCQVGKSAQSLLRAQIMAGQIKGVNATIGVDLRQCLG